MSRYNMDPKLGGVKQDHAKARWHLLPDELLEGVIAVLEVGAEKYSEWNWANGMPYSRVYDSLRRHLNAFWQGEDLDPETKLPHLDHLICNAIFLKYFTQRYPHLDDRPRHLKTPPVEVGPTVPQDVLQDCSSAIHPEAIPSSPVRKGGPYEEAHSDRRSVQLPLPHHRPDRQVERGWNPPPPGSVLFEIPGVSINGVPELTLSRPEVVVWDTTKNMPVRCLTEADLCKLRELHTHTSPDPDLKPTD